jgi:hypothetical protein
MRRPVTGIAGDGVDWERTRCLAAGAVTLIRGLALHRRGKEREAPFGTSVVELHQGAVFVLWNQHIARKEEGILPISADSKEA